MPLVLRIRVGSGFNRVSGSGFAIWIQGQEKKTKLETYTYIELHVLNSSGQNSYIGKVHLIPDLRPLFSNSFKRSRSGSGIRVEK